MFTKFWIVFGVKKSIYFFFSMSCYFKHFNAKLKCPQGLETLESFSTLGCNSPAIDACSIVLKNIVKYEIILIDFWQNVLLLLGISDLFILHRGPVITGTLQIWCAENDNLTYWYELLVYIFWCAFPIGIFHMMFALNTYISNE